MSRPSKPSLTDNPLDDICPVCKSNRYLNPSLQFLINPECYHKMCSTCVDRIFTSGPTCCPVPRCGKTLRKRGFHQAFFGDLKIEEECDIRKRVGDVFNRRQEDFETLRHWNDYLQDVEDLVFDLVKGSAKTKRRAEETLEEYRVKNLAVIEENKKAGQEAASLERQREKAEREAAKQRRLAMAREEEEEKMDVEKMKRSALDRLANSNEDANAIARQAQKGILKKTSARRTLTDAPTNESTTSVRDSGLSIRGLKKKVAPVVEKEYDPFGGIDLTPTRYILQDHYENDYLAGFVKGQPTAMTGGYSLHEYYGRSMLEAFSGLGVFIEDEIASRNQPAAMATIKAEARDDVF
ncbi:hypothetical protein HYALB_00003880 [Hymenoscyphus albidus]|uniref:RNA polymerase II transcription factor B subunit 3 n=1 Tax=Hymenoscyphus albidus TaxID=595503 RepID=A0A9N9LX09_9HELO|nr:hypothetical protein HYALB_00003880 [Hymenoscyphus albidus]